MSETPSRSSASAEADGPYDHVWHWRVKLPERKGQRCRVLTRGRMGTVVVEFEDGFKVATGRHAVRRASTA